MYKTMTIFEFLKAQNITTTQELADATYWMKCVVKDILNNPKQNMYQHEVAHQLTMLFGFFKSTLDTEGDETSFKKYMKDVFTNKIAKVDNELANVILTLNAKGICKINTTTKEVFINSNVPRNTNILGLIVPSENGVSKYNDYLNSTICTTDVLEAYLDAVINLDLDKLNNNIKLIPSLKTLDFKKKDQKIKELKELNYNKFKEVNSWITSVIRRKYVNKGTEKVFVVDRKNKVIQEVLNSEIIIKFGKTMYDEREATITAMKEEIYGVNVEYKEKYDK